MRAFPILISCIAAFAVLWGLTSAADLEDVWWQYPLARARLIVAVYWSAVAVLLVCSAAALRLVFGGPGHRLAGAFSVMTCIWLALYLASAPTQADLEEFGGVASGRIKPAQISYSIPTGEIHLRGGLKFGSAARFKEVLDAAPEARVVVLDSPGGYIEEAKWIAWQIEQRGMDTLVTRECASACVDIFASGRRRTMYADAVVGLHSASGGDPAGIQQANKKFEERLYRIGVEPRFLMYGSDTPAQDIWNNTARQAYLAGLATHVVDPATAKP
jgi:ATP-dependent protease ClpP protease subunit